MEIQEGIDLVWIGYAIKTGMVKGSETLWGPASDEAWYMFGANLRSMYDL